MTAEIFARVVAVGAASCVPDRPDAVDLEVWRGRPSGGGELLGEVTLLRDHAGAWSPWGDFDNWCAGDVQHWLTEDEAPEERRAELLAACREAIRTEDPFR